MLFGNRPSSPLRLALAALAWALSTGCARDSRPNLIIVLVDTLRPDHLGYHGYGRDTSPRVDALATESVVFANHYSHASRTGPSVASIFTGLHPRSHGVVNPLTHFDAKGTLSEAQTTLAEILSARGYDCHGIIANFNILPRFGFGQGFKTYELVQPTTASEINRAAFATLKNRHEPFFLYLHYMEPHSPYAAPLAYRYRYVDRNYTGEIDGSHQQLDEIVAGTRQVDAEDVDHLQALYDQEIRYFDDEFGRLLDFLDAEGLRANTLLLFVSDHGEEFLEHGSVLHGYTLYEEQLWVPCFIHDPRSGDSVRVEAVTRHVDLLPTLLALMEIPPPDGLQGRSLFPLMHARGDPPSEALPVFAQASLRAVKTIQMQSIMADGWKLIETEVPEPTEELFHVAVDPGETQNLAGERPEVTERMRVAMQEFVEALPVGEGGMVELSETDKARLRSLGYLR